MLRDSSDSVAHNIRAIASSRLIWIRLVLFGRLLTNENTISVQNMDQNVPFGFGVHFFGPNMDLLHQCPIF